MYAPLMDKPQKVRDKVLGRIIAALQSANEKLETLVVEHHSAPAQTAQPGS
jgi:hypothetical protein